MKLILSQEVDNLGAVGEVVNVRGGYARNFLLPRKLAVMANDRNKAELDHQIRLLEKKKNLLLEAARKQASVIEKISVTVTKQVGDAAFLITAYPTDAIKEGVRLWPN